MDDVISQGDEPKQPSGRRRAAAAGVAGAIVAVAVISHLPSGVWPHSGPASGSSKHRIGESGAPVSGGLRLPVAGVQPAWFWPATGRLQTIGGLARQPTGYAFTRLGDGWAVQADPLAPARCGGYCAGPQRRVYYLASGARSAVPVGSATSVAPAAVAGAMWLSSEPPGANLATAAVTAREVTATGVQVGRAVKLPGGYEIDRGTVAGLLLTRQVWVWASPTFLLWNPARARVSRSFRHLLAASPTEIAWTSPCRVHCVVHVLALETGRLRTIRLPAGGTAIEASFSPDGRFLAVLVGLGIQSGVGGALGVRIEAAAVTTRRVLIMPPASLWSGGLAGFGWPASDDMLVTEFGIASAMRLTAWHPGGGRAGSVMLGLAVVTAGLVTG